MIIKPSVTELLTKAKNRYELVIATSKRARQIAEGDEPLIKIKDKSPVNKKNGRSRITSIFYF